MAITTYVDRAQAAAWRRDIDAELETLLLDIQQETGEQWAIMPINMTKEGWWAWRTPERGYILHKWLHKTPMGDEWQVINFYQDHRDTSLNTCVSKAVIMAYLHGYLGGLSSHRVPESNEVLPDCRSGGDTM